MSGLSESWSLEKSVVLAQLRLETAAVAEVDEALV
jgi:hypothetical protein